MKLDLIQIIILIAVVLNIFVSIFLARRNDLGPFQKTAQIVIVWLFPYIAAIGLWFFNRSHDSPNRPDKKAFGGGNNDLPPGSGCAGS